MCANVLVVDDNTDVADLYATQLSAEHDVRTAYGGREALDRLDEDVGVVLLDRHMPDLEGDEVLDRIRETEYDCRVAMVTAVDPDFDIVDLGFDEYVTKPVDREQLLDTVDRLVARTGYSETIRRYYALVSTRAALEAEKRPAELEQSDEYEALTARIDALADELSEAAPEADDAEEWAALLRTVLDEQGTG